MMTKDQHRFEADAGPTVFRHSFQSGELAVRKALAQVLDSLRPLKLAVEETGTVELVMAEVLNNIVEHAYSDRSEGGRVEIQYVAKPDGLNVCISDNGNMMPDGKLPTGTLASLEVDMPDLPEGGFGWFLIQHLAKDVTYQRVGKRNVLQMRIAVGMDH